jgi:putative oxidoreductase
MKIIRMGLVVLARFSLSIVFLAAAINKILNWHEVEKNLLFALSDWQTYVGYLELALDFFSQLTSWAPLLLILATLLELVGGLLILLGIQERWGAALLLLFLIPVTVIMHPFWFIEGPTREIQTIMFLKNLAIMGGLLLVVLNGTQPQAKGNDPFQMKL